MNYMITMGLQIGKLVFVFSGRNWIGEYIMNAKKCCTHKLSVFSISDTGQVKRYLPREMKS